MNLALAKSGYIVCVNAMAEGITALVRDAGGEPFLFATRELAEREIAESLLARVHEYLNGERDFDDAVSVEEFVVAVHRDQEGVLMDEFGVGYPRQD